MFEFVVDALMEETIVPMPEANRFSRNNGCTPQSHGPEKQLVQHLLDMMQVIIPLEY
jgi:hypothetical protein